MECVKVDLSEGEVQQSLRKVVPRIQEVPPQGFFSVPAESVVADFFNVKVYFCLR